MVLSTQVADRNRQSASLYPFPLTPLLGVLNFASAGIVVGILIDFVYELRGDGMSVPIELTVAAAAAILTIVEQAVAFACQKLSRFNPKFNLGCHLVLTIFWIIAFGLLTFKLHGMVLAHTCTLTLWQTEMGLMVCRMYKAMYAFSAVCVATSIAGALLDLSVIRGDSAGVYRPLADPMPYSDVHKSPYVDVQKTPDISVAESPMLKE